MPEKRTPPIWVELLMGLLPAVLLGLLLGLLINIGLPMMIIAGATDQYQKQIEAGAKISHLIEGVIVKVESGEDPEYTAWNKEKSSGVRLWLKPTDYTTLYFKDGRVKKFAGVPDFEVPLDKPVRVHYDGNATIKSIEGGTNESDRPEANPLETRPQSQSV